jgi:hypothetical protein
MLFANIKELFLVSEYKIIFLPTTFTRNCSLIKIRIEIDDEVGLSEFCQEKIIWKIELSGD